VELGLAREVRIFPSLASETAAAARHVAERARTSVRARGSFSIVLAGGRTPQGLYRLLARRYRRVLPWPATDVFFGDERCVPPEDPESNYALASESLLSHVPVAPRRVHRLRGELRPPSKEAERYSRAIGPLPPLADPPEARFDLVLLGVGPDGHTASLFPGDPALKERRRTVVAVRRPGQPPLVPRLTLTLPALASSREVCFLVSGSEKAAAVGSIFRSFPDGDARFPASLVRTAGATIWFLDRAAASDLPSGVRAR